MVRTWGTGASRDTPWTGRDRLSFSEGLGLSLTRQDWNVFGEKTRDLWRPRMSVLGKERLEKKNGLRMRGPYRNLKKRLIAVQ